MTPLLGRPLSEFIFVDGSDPAAVARSSKTQLKQTEITQPAVLATDLALTRMLGAYGVEPDMVMGHSLGEYGALVAAGALDFGHALEAVSARGHEMASLQIEDNGAMAAVIGPMAEIERIVDAVDGYVVVANVNSMTQAVIGGATARRRGGDTALRRRRDDRDAHPGQPRLPHEHRGARERAVAAGPPRAWAARASHPAGRQRRRRVLPDGRRCSAQMVDILGRQVASPVQFVKGLDTLYDAGARVFVEVGPKKALHGFTEDVLGREHDDVLALFTNHPKQGDVVAFNHALCGSTRPGSATPRDARARAPAVTDRADEHPAVHHDIRRRAGAIRELFDEFVERGRAILAARDGRRAGRVAAPNRSWSPAPRSACPGPLVCSTRPRSAASSAASSSSTRFLRACRREILDKHITRLVKRDDADRAFETIDSPDEVVKLAAGPGVRPRRRVRCRARSRRRARRRDQARDRRRLRRATGRRYPARHALQDDQHRDPAARSVDAARRAARRHRHHLRLGFPGFDAFADDLERALRRPQAPRRSSRCSTPCAPRCATAMTRPPRGRPSDRRAA